MMVLQNSFSLQSGFWRPFALPHADFMNAVASGQVLTTEPLRGSVLSIQVATQNSNTLDLRNLPVAAGIQAQNRRIGKDGK
jgi:hypothetical protein